MMRNGFVKGMTIGIMAGTAIGMAVVPKKKSYKNSMRRTLKTAGEVVGGITDAILS